MYAYIVTDLMNGKVVGTDDKSKAEELSYCEDYFVVDVKNETWLVEGTGQAIPEMD